jgi:hypothetical protein
MFSLRLGKHVKLELVALATLALTAGSASADVILNFIELPNGSIHLTGMESNGALIDQTKPAAEFFRVSAPGCVGIAGCNPDFTTNQIGTPTEYLVNIRESAAGPLSDQVFVHRLTAAGGSQVIDFISDTGFVTAGPATVVTTVVETGSLQFALSYLNDANGQPVTINVSSPLAAIPEPATLALVGLALLGLATMRRRKPARCLPLTASPPS